MKIQIIISKIKKLEQTLRNSVKKPGKSGGKKRRRSKKEKAGCGSARLVAEVPVRLRMFPIAF